MISQKRFVQIVTSASEQWRSKNRELFSCFDTEKLWERIHAFVDLEPDTDLGNFTKSLDFGEVSMKSIMRAAISEELFPDREERLAAAIELALDRAFLTLFDRGALSSLLVLEEIPPRGQKAMDRIASRVEAAKPTPKVQVAPPPQPVDPVAQCVKDFHELGMQAFKQKYMNDTRNRIFYETAIDRGLI